MGRSYDGTAATSASTQHGIRRSDLVRQRYAISSDRYDPARHQFQGPECSAWTTSRRAQQRSRDDQTLAVVGRNGYRVHDDQVAFRNVLDCRIYYEGDPRHSSL
ncbi:hypothetical protein CLAFUW4_13795 [Fulvia fulva]|uniref:Uncharacterized protein n=1 Tax=Passalora fulva TaxID=5499 RepID=A0A9Q8PKS0_PASFU|nr:uncharacterized protein CLAFUR5_13641 [Fulvia fulva]KAK4610518.1 hypothetical protein CLAFUR4_13798 [Fulvia fulva]KAK4610911.1 hypothetical protein CLAFUR0_13802 [Fulvia fulva]UJO24268.1 hypothetical protein CLAFUR5_13641 [Fulvia fulva]WPV22074.1 hypothetical protein CLAFUW4_13795 [Fulvia fulva]WPV37336.1 hypothetical protein CLAFUW7_13803 [Fulvia fulva]